MPAKVRTLIDVHEQNAPGRFQDYDWQVVRPQLDPAITITETFSVRRPPLTPTRISLRRARMLRV